MLKGNPQIYRPRRSDFNPITRVFLWASKTDHELCSLASWWATSTQVALGVFVCLTALLAFASANYLMKTFHVAEPGATCAALGFTAPSFCGMRIA